MGLNDVILLGLLAGFIGTATATECYQCSDFEAETSSPLLEKMLKGKTSALCGWGFGSSTKTCASNAVCGLVKGTVTGSSFLGNYKIKTYVRDCFETQQDGCVSELHGVSAVVNGVVAVALDFVEGLGSIHLQADFCTCNTDFCNPDPCEDGEINFFQIGCFKIWILIVIGGGALFLLISFCVCCYCCCCKKKRTQGMVIMTGSQPGFVVPVSSTVPLSAVQVAAGDYDGGIANPMYVVAK